MLYMNIDNAVGRYVGYGKETELLERDTALKDTNFISAIVGPRRAGKSSIMILYMQKLYDNGENPVFINGEDIDFAGITADSLDDVESAIHRIYDLGKKGKAYLFIDEVQSLPEWSRWLRTLFDEGTYRIFVSGSTSELTKEKLPSELRGRALEIMVLPFSYREYCNAKGVAYSKYPKPADAGALAGALEDFLEYGGYPEVVKTEDAQLKRVILSDLYNTVIRHDLIEKYKIRKVSEFKAFTNAMFGSACRHLSVPNLVRWFKDNGIMISSQTASNYVNYAASVFMVYLLYPYSRKLKERNTKPKLYALDSGILGLFEKDMGKKLENTILVELVRRRKEVYYYDADAADVDFVVIEEGRVAEVIQVSYSIDNAETYLRETASLANASKKLKCENALILTFNEEKTLTSGGVRIRVVPAWKWLLEEEKPSRY